MTERRPALPILFVDDEEDALESYRLAGKFDGLENLILCQDSRQVAGILAAQEISLAVLDLSMPNVDGRELLGLITENYPQVPVIVITANNAVDEAVACIRRGAVDYLVKPVERARLSVALAKAIEMRELRREVEDLSRNIRTEGVQNPDAFKNILTSDPKMLAIFKYAESIARSAKPVLITGESGVGKEAIARAIYELSECTGEFVAVNIAGLDDTLFSDTLFGHEKGAYSGADSRREGMARKAENGMLFLDEIGDLEIGSQVKLLRLLQESEYFALGSDARRTFSARIITATNAELPNLIARKRFRTDLYHRLSTHLLHIPPLRQRLEDLPLLTRFFADEASCDLKKPCPKIHAGLCDRLNAYGFPGNIRELQSMIYDAVARDSTGNLDAECLDAYLQAHAELVEKIIRGGQAFPQLRETEDWLLTEALERAGGKQSIAAKLLGISQSTISRKMRKMQMDKDG